MSHVRHELAEDFPDQVEQIHELKTGNAHFARLADEYHVLNREIHRIETGIEPTSDQRETELRKKRMVLKDELAAIMASAKE